MPCETACVSKRALLFKGHIPNAAGKVRTARADGKASVFLFRLRLAGNSAVGGTAVAGHRIGMVSEDGLLEQLLQMPITVQPVPSLPVHTRWQNMETSRKEVKRHVL